ncbi:putative alpha/beta fold family hydrolase [Exophiala viscosa]|uniref:Alpha/beta fold family hydrolase n=1 Tax=Exophiala viscosa TaxID=2486360 RepID=A0AAN6DY32_9EURO|nr:putative alpha/beta fold family hydrolase [Exophiala viscosa]KAI1626069.1 putative alpha/beta fold family hydrolase [Exophiala viscosa]
MAEEPLLSAIEYGGGFPILFVHGWTMRGQAEAYDFEPIFEGNKDFRRIYVDLPGMGSTPANGIQDLDDIFERLTQFIDERFSTSSNFALAGSSCGGYLARALAQKYNDRVDGLLLRVPLMEPDDRLRDRDPFESLVQNKNFMASLPAEHKAVLGDHVLIQTPTYHQALRNKYKDVYLPATEAADNKVLEPIRADPRRYSLSSPNFDPARERLLAPTLILVGRQDEDVGYRDSLRLTERYPRSTHVVLDRGVHALPVDERNLFDALVRDWIYRIKEWRSSRDAQNTTVSGRRSSRTT